MTYRDNVQALCDARGIPNPIQESNLHILSLEFYGYLEGCQTVIEATDMNRASRLFIQSAAELFDDSHLYHHAERRRDRQKLILTSSFKLLASIYFAELWLDAGKGTRTLIDALYANDWLEITWK
jgi:hypothetical protein